ncbi:hypothetical protein K461DRAFT_244666 [Myriangium duriaei CBS 260.36]|uniref:Nuclear pore complex protein Nup85 n=1 Tax=Myriangium duriaei CBS 260.36 TaxID=1168546 RepID=A0A9P4IZR7_9PEZI|nr:hypothetical protein K461DRAFT_244666 [Myriangium duriaei CBS 260.36]
MFNVPSTPDSRRGDDIDILSTTPAGPPPSSVLGSSFGPGTGLNAKSPFSLSAFIKSPADRAPSNRVSSRGFAVPSSSPAQRDRSGYLDDVGLGANGTGKYGPGGNARPGTQTDDDLDDILDFNSEPRGAKRSRNGDVMAQSMRSSRMVGRDIDRDSIMPSIVDGLVAGLPDPPSLQEDDDTILSTENTLETLDDAARRDEDDLEQALAQAVKELNTEWVKQVDTESVAASIGPVDKSGFARAFYVATLLLQLHHPATANRATSSQLPSFTALNRLSSQPTPLPRALLDWLNKNHNPFPEDLPEVQSAKPSSTAHDRFWDTVFQALLRGQFSTVIKLLSSANWSHADTALEDGYSEPGYTGAQLQAVQYVVGQCVELLRTCPALTDDDWTVSGGDWSLFRSRARRYLEDLEQYAESNSADREYGNTNVFAAGGGSFAAGSRRAESRVPWSVLEQLKAVYGQLLGSREEILLSAQDWLEASIYLTVWWDGNEEGSLGASRRGLPARQRDRLVDADPIRAYQRRLLLSFASVTDEPEDVPLGVNTVDAVQVALGAVFEGEVESVLKLLQKWSPLVATAVVDVASAGGWMPLGRPRTGDVMNGFDQEDLMVLSHGQINQKEGLDRDSVLTNFAELLAKEEQFESSDGRTVQQGWELAVHVLSRLDSTSAAQKKIGEVFSAMTFTNAKQVDKALSVCNSLGLTEQVRGISERYADSLATTSHSYGQALLYYARAHSEAQLQSTLDLLLSTSLVRSAAYPAHAELDPQLADLLSNQTGVLSQLARIDVEAAKLLANKSSGYATLRRFYELRDEDNEVEEEEESAFKSGLKPAARKKEMVKGLVALVESAGESIRGGLYDATAVGVVQVETLLSLLGEALPMLNDSTPLFNKPQLIALLRAIEDLQTVSSRIYDQAETLFQASMSDFQSGRATDPQDLAKSLQMGKSTSNLAGSTYGMVNSRGSIESEQAGAAGGSGEDSRAWDWRRGLALTAGKSAKGSDVLRILRIAIAREIGRTWAEGR